MYFETTNRPWFGPRKRAREFISQSTTETIEPKLSINLILESIGLHDKDVNHLKFYDFICKEDKHRYTIVVIQTISDPIIRNKVFNNALKCVESCGWYPLVQGERLNSIGSKGLETIEEINIDYQFNKVLGYEAACKDGDGTSIRILFENGSILFDSAFPNKLYVKDSDKIIFLSHSHSDHSGGINALLNSEVKIILNKETYSILCAKNVLDNTSTYSNLYVIGSNAKINIQSYIIKAFPVPHCFGSIGFIADLKTIELLFTGDIVIKTNRFDFTEELIRQFNSKESKKIIFLDATMCMRKDGASQIDSAHELINNIENSEIRNVVVTSRDSEQLIYALIDLFFYIKNNNRHQYSFVLPRKIKRTISILHENFIKSNYKEIDRLIYSQYGNSKSSWGESRWIYWIKYENEIDNIIQTSKTIFFIPHNEIDNYQTITRFPFINIGKTGEEFTSKFKSIGLKIDSTPWTMHSNNSVLTESILKFHENGIETVIFHDYSKRMSKYIEQFDFKVRAMNTSFNSF